MKKIALLGVAILVIALMAATTQVLASPLTVTAKGTGNPHDTGATPTGDATHGPPAGNPNPSLATPGAEATAHAGLQHGKPEIYRGTIASVNSTSLMLTLDDGSSLTIGLTPDTKIKVPGPQSAGDTLAMGQHVMVMAFRDSGNNLVARMVVVIPGQPQRVHRVGTVTSYTPGSSITIKASDGSSSTFTLTTDTKILPQDQAANLKVGSLVTIIAPRVPSSTTWTAIGIVVHPSQ